MTLCPVAIAVGCRKCPIFNVCPAKSIIGDHKQPEIVETKKPSNNKKSKSNKKKK